MIMFITIGGGKGDWGAEAPSEIETELIIMKIDQYSLIEQSKLSNRTIST